MNAEQEEALNRLIRIARSDTGQSRKVAAFLLSWWNARTCGGFDLTHLWAVDSAIAEDMITVILMISEIHLYPDTLGFGPAFEALVEQWRPHLFQDGSHE